MNRNQMEKESKIIFIGQELQAVQKNAVTSTPQASYSTILSLAAYLCYHIPNTPPPGVKPTNQNKLDQVYPSPQLSYNYYMEPWCDYLTNLCVTALEDKGHWLIEKEQQVFVGRVTDAFIESLHKEGEQIFQFQKNGKGSQIFLKKTEKTGKRIALINFAASQLRTDIYRPKIHIFGLLLGIWQAQNEEWKNFNIFLDQYPTESDLQNIDVFIFSGSHYSVNDENPKVIKTVKMIMQARQKRPTLKIIGLCFGHQAIAKHYGGKVEKRPLIAGIERIFFKENVSKKYAFLNVLEGEEESKPLYISEYHEDNVLITPQGFQIVCWSNSCANEAMVSNDKKIFSFQFHSQYTHEYTRSYELRVKAYFPDDPIQNFAGEIKQQYQKNQVQHQISQSCMKIRKIVRNFIDYDQ